MISLRLKLTLRRWAQRAAGAPMIPLIRGLFWLARALGPERSGNAGAALAGSASASSATAGKATAEIGV